MVPFVHLPAEVTLELPGVNPRIFGRLKGVVVSVSQFSERSRSPGLGDAAQHLEAQHPPGDRCDSSMTLRLGLPVDECLRDRELQLQSRTPVSGELSVASSPSPSCWGSHAHPLLAPPRVEQECRGLVGQLRHDTTWPCHRMSTLKW